MVRLPGDVNTIPQHGIHEATKILQRHLHINIVSGVGSEARNVLSEVCSPLIPTWISPAKEVSPSLNPLQYVR